MNEFNLLTKPWIPVLWADGRWDEKQPPRVGIKQALTEAGRIRQIAASNPMDRVAILRFLLAVLYWCKGNPPRNEDEASADSFPADWFSKLDDNKDRFNLLGDEKRFFQDKQLLQKMLEEKQKQWDKNEAKKKSKATKRTGTSGQRPTSLDGSDFRPIGDLLQEFPTETKIAHFRHVRDKEYGLCPACCALGIIRFCAFANAYGGGRYTSGINGATPAYAIPQGATLQKTLQLNLPKSTGLNREPPWLCDKAPSQNDLDLATVFAWRSRRLWLGDLGEDKQICSYCGQSGRLIKQLAFTGGWPLPFPTKGKQKKFWGQDPHLIFEPRKKGKGESDENPEDTPGDETASDDSSITKPGDVTTIGFPAPGSSVTAHARFWRRALAATLARAQGTGGSAIPLAVAVAGPAANIIDKALYKDAAALSLPSAADDVKLAARDVVALQTGVMQQLIGVLRRSTPNPQRQHPSRKAALDAQSPSLETRLREEFEKWLISQATSSGGIASAVEFCRDQLIEQLRPVVEAVVAATTPGSALRQQEAMQRAEDVLWLTVRQIERQAAKAADGQERPEVADSQEAAKGNRKPHKSQKKGATT